MTQDTETTPVEDKELADDNVDTATEIESNIDHDDDAGEDSGEQTPSRRRLRKPKVRTVAVGAAFLVVLAAAVFFGINYVQLRGNQQAQDAALTAGKQYMLQLAGFNYQDPNEVKNAILPHVTTTYSKDVTAALNTLVPALTKNKASMKPQIVAAAVQSFDGTTAQLMFFVNQTVTTPGQQAGQPTGFRFTMSLVRQDGDWKIDNMNNT